MGILGIYLALGLSWQVLSRSVGGGGVGGGWWREWGNDLAFMVVSAITLSFCLCTVRRQADAAQRMYRDAAVRYQAVMESSLDAIHLVAPDGKLVEANASFYRSLGYDPAKPPVLSASDWDACLESDEIVSKIAMILEAPQVFETRHRLADGTLRDVEVTATGVTLGGSRLALCVARDISGRVQLQNAQMRAERLESLGLLAGGIAHDLNNALAPIIIGAELLQARHPESADDSLLSSMVVSAQRGAGIIRQLLTFARGVDGERLMVPLRPLLAGLAHQLEQTLPSIVRVELVLPSDLPLVTGDASQLSQVLLSLANNARDAMPQGGRLVLGARVRTLTDVEVAGLGAGAGAFYVELSVRDTGPGISREAEEHLFEPFFTTKPRGRGTGLGLSTALGIVRSHRGTIEHVRPADGGSEFRVLLPIRGEEEDDTSDKTRETRSEQSEVEPMAASPLDRLIDGDGRVLMVVEDDAAVRCSTRAVLERHGFKVVEASDGAAALGVLGILPTPPVLVLTDLMMPRMPGDVLARRVRERIPGLPVVAMTGLHADDPRAPDVGSLLARGDLAGLLVKPFNEGQLLAVLSRALEGAAGKPAGVVKN
jgi:PAS domain S-box-containing protein